MPDFTATAINEMLDWLTGVANPPSVATRYITVFDGDPQGAGTEVIDDITGSTDRIDMTTEMSAASSGAATNATDVVFTASASGSATVDYVAVYDAITSGNLLASTQVTSKSVTAGDSLSILAGNLDFTIT